MYKQKYSKGEKSIRSNYTFHNSKHHDNKLSHVDCIRFTSIDPGVVNFAIRIEDRYSNGIIKPLLFQLISLENYPNPYIRLNEIFKQIYNLLLNTHVFIIEEQLGVNNSCVRISQHVISYLIHEFDNTELQPIICEIKATEKTKKLGCPKVKGKPDKFNKRWCEKKAKELLEIRGDYKSINIINKQRDKR